VLAAGAIVGFDWSLKSFFSSLIRIASVITRNMIRTWEIRYYALIVIDNHL
jgi:hypothetical protein